MQLTRQTPRSSTVHVHVHAIVAATLALGLVLAIAAVAWAAPSLTIDSGPSGPTNDASPSFGFTADLGATVDCSIDAGTPAYGPCSGAATHAPDTPLPDGDYVFRVRANDGVEETVMTRSFSVDTVAPSLSIESGPSDPTNNASPSFGFSAEPGATVECSVDQDSPVYGPCSSAASHTAPTLADGSYTFRVRATDAAGNAAVATRAFSVDTVAPAVGVTSGPSGPTNDNTPSFGFSTDPGATVECSVDQGFPAFGPCTTATSHTAASLPDGSYVFRVRATDGAGNQASASQTFSVDTAAPSLSIDSGPTGPTKDATPTFGFTAEAGATRQCSVDQGTPAYGPCSSSTTHTPTALPDGPYIFRVRATDAAGTPAVLTRSFSVDTTPPAVGVTSGPSGPTNDNTPSFGFSTDPGATVECSVDQGFPAFGSCTTTTSHTAAALPDGSYVFRVRATDGAGNQASASQTFSVDTADPAVGVTSGPSGPTNDTTPSFGFSAEPGATIACSVDQGSPAFASCTTPYTPAPLADGSYVFRVRATDAAGNAAVATRAFSVDTVAPAVGVTSGPAGPTNDTSPSFGFTAEAGATVECSVDQGAPAFASCTTPHTPPPLADGAYTFRVRATDAAGNAAVATRQFSVDSAAPSLSIDSGPEGPTKDTTPSFAFTAEAGATVECSVDHGTPAYGPCSGVASHTAAALAEGSYTFRVRATDEVDHEAILSRTFTVDTTPPSLAFTFGPSGTMSDTTPLFGFTAEAGATVECSIDRGTPAYVTCASATTHAPGAPLVDGAYTFRVRATDAAGNQRTVTRAFTLDTLPQVPDPGSSPTPPTTPPTTPPVTPPTTTPVTPAPDGPRLLSPFPLVRISGALTPRGARIRLLSVRAPLGTLVRVTVTPPCSGKQQSSRRCRPRKAGGTVGRSALIDFRSLARTYRSGTVIVVRVWRADRIGKYTRFTIVRGKAPRRVDQCLVPQATHGSRCPSA